LKAFDIFAEFLAFSPDEGSFHDWLDSANLFLSQDVPFLYQGDWAAGTFDATNEFTYGDDWGFFPFPGTDGSYTYSSDGFLQSTESVTGTNDLLEFLGSRESIEAFTSTRGGVPTRRDVDRSSYHEFFQSQIEAFEKASTINQTIAHGNGISAEKLIELKLKMSEFLMSMDTENATSKFVDVLSTEE
jgi:glucose/mannose transport system substrate-binding protein